MKNLIFLIIPILFIGCIKDDILSDTVDPVLRLTQKAEAIAIDESFQFEFIYLNNVGREESVAVTWSSSAPDVISISQEGLATALSTGNSTISIEYQDENGLLTDAFEVVVGDETVEVEETQEKSGQINTTSTYALSGDFTLTAEENNLVLVFDENYNASTALPGLYVYLTNNPSTISGALEIGKVETFSGAHSYSIADVDINEYSHILYFCKPFNVKVGDGEIQDN